MKFKKGQKVHTVEDHKYLGITKKMVGVVTELDAGYLLKHSVEVGFRNGKRIIFGAEELRKVK